MPGRKTEEDRAYFARRAREEREKAAASDSDAAMLVHRKLAEEYARKAGEPFSNPDPIAS
jgi:hypothetical protein